MPRVRKGAARNQERKRILKAARGYYGVKHKHRYQAENALVRAGVYRFRDRRRLKRDMRRLWITRVTAACRMRGTRYSVFMNGLKLAGIVLNRKMLSQVAIEDPKLFDRICEIAVKSSRASGGGAQLEAGSASPLKKGVLERSAKGKVKSGKPSAGVKAPRGASGAASGSGASGEGDIRTIEGIGPAYAAKLSKVGIHWVRELLDRGATKVGRAEIAEKSGLREKQILDWVNMADLMRVPGVDGNMAELLHAAGVDTVKELATRVPANLSAKMGEVNKAKSLAPQSPAESMVSQWVSSAKSLAAKVEH